MLLGANDVEWTTEKVPETKASNAIPTNLRDTR